jgi:alkylation response protein AidB-like acyl-CoA dehydrogenase
VVDVVDLSAPPLTDVLERVRAAAASVPPDADQRAWLGARFDTGLAWVHFPEGMGGSGLSRDVQRLVDAEFGLINPAAAPINGARNPIGLGMGAPTIAAHGTPAQQARLLRPLWTGEEIWCQLFSEPGAGSDLAGLATRAEREGDSWRINGQKVWTSYAHKARWGMLLARTDPDVPKHAGLTYFFLDMHAPGVEVRPLRQATGQAEFNEVFLTDVLIGDDMRVGAVGEGWKIANTTLMNERVALGSGAPQREQEPIASVLRLWAECPDLRTPELHSRLLKVWVQVETARLANARIGQQMLAGRPGPEGSASKLTFALNNQEATRLRLELAGDDGLEYDDWTLRPVEQGQSSHRPTSYHYLRARANSIEGGSTEILRGVIADRILGLPREPRADADRPWKDIPR